MFIIITNDTPSSYLISTSAISTHVIAHSRDSSKILKFTSRIKFIFCADYEIHIVKKTGTTYSRMLAV